MKQPEFYPHPVQEPIRLIQTHASAVFLTGDYAYKLKKPVNFGFLDFSTLAKRQHFLRQELRINQPIAPDIYLEVLPINQSGNLLSLSGKGESVEYALKMQQFPQDALLINMFQQGNLREWHLQELGKVVARFHVQAQTNEYIRSFGEIGKIQATITDNYQKTQKYIGVVQKQQQYEETKFFTDRYLSDKKAFFQERQIQDKIKECHGDLHLKNICFWHDRIQLFDRIEFNESFRFVDTMYDIAFTVMDLDAKGRQDFSYIFLNTYLEETGDWDGLQVLPLYLSRQAYVRAKVTSLLLDDVDVSQAEKQEAIATATNYYHLAWKYSQKAQAQIIVMSGLSGSGKTTVAKQLAKKLKAIHIRSDAMRKQLAGIALEERGGEELYTPQMNQKTYDRLLDLGIMAAKAGFTVILDAKYDRIIWREPIISQAQSQQFPLQIIHCIAPIEVLRDRLAQRTGDISDATPRLLVQQQNTAEPFSESEQAYLKTLDTSQANWLSTLDSWLN